MAKKKQTGQFVLVEQPADAELEPEITPDIDELRALAEMEGGGDVKWTVFRTSDVGDKKAGYCGTLSTGDVSFQKVAEEWGRGTYRIRGTRSNGQFVRQQTVTISEDPRRPIQQLMPAGPANSVQDMIALMDAREAASMEKMLKWAAILTPLLTPVLSNLFTGNKGTSLTELTTALANIKQLDGGTKVDQMQEFTKLLELVDRVKGDGDGGGKVGSNWVDVVRDGISSIPNVLGMIVAAKSGQPLPVSTTPSSVAPTLPASTNTGDPMLQLLSWLKTQLEALTHQANLNKDPGLYAEVVLDNLPAGADPKVLRDILAGDDWWSKLAAFSPGVQPYQGWFVECRTELLRGLDAMIAPPPAGDGAAVAEPPVKSVKSKK